MNVLQSLEYPLDIETILRKKKTIKKHLLSQPHLLEKKVAVLGGSTTAEVVNILDIFLLKNGIKATFYESQYNRFYEDALFGTAELDTFNPDVIYIHTTQENIVGFPELNASKADCDTALEQEIIRYQSIWQALQRYDCAIVQNNFELPLRRSLGNLDSQHQNGKAHFINQLNLAFARNAQECPTLYIQDIHYLSSWIGLQNWYDHKLWCMAKYALSFQALPWLAHNLAGIIKALFGQAKKCLVLDLDNTCWGGVIGDDGLSGIAIGTDSALGEAHHYFQQYVRELKQRGVMLAVCSKNDEQNALSGFSHPDSVLQAEDFIVFKANWEAKHVNIKAIAEEINIGMDSLVFVDDNPVERNLVSGQLSEVTVPNIGDDVTRYIDFLDRSSYFEPVSLSADDQQRNRYYAENKKRTQAQEQYADYREFLLSLQMTAEIKSFSNAYLTRITQLINKTNQFNLTTQRHTQAEIEAITANQQQIKLYGRLTDKYGDNGLISVVIAEIKERECHIRLWLMSCRVLKRDMELAMLDSLVHHCLAAGVRELFGYYYATAKNQMVAKHYEQLGFSLTQQKEQDSVWKLTLQNYQYLNKVIKVEHD